MQLDYIRSQSVSVDNITGLTRRRGCIFVKNLAGKSENVGERIAPGIAREAGFAAGLFQKFFARKMMFGSDLRKQQSSPLFAGNHQSMLADFDVLRIDL